MTTRRPWVAVIEYKSPALGWIAVDCFTLLKDATTRAATWNRVSPRLYRVRKYVRQP